MEIPYTALSPDALRGVIEEFISREGTDYGEQEFTLEDKIGQVRSQLESGEVVLTFDEETETCNLVRVR
ncbi:MAG: YheU family protein [Proteobacteria bacterium]|nr:YheU family protein [Pseudomonadota bacterium]MDA0929239.1 YheU family protein [Pseudomonadota bacterium]